MHNLEGCESQLNEESTSESVCLQSRIAGEDIVSINKEDSEENNEEPKNIRPDLYNRHNMIMINNKYEK